MERSSALGPPAEALGTAAVRPTNATLTCMDWQAYAV